MKVILFRALLACILTVTQVARATPKHPSPTPTGDELYVPLPAERLAVNSRRTVQGIVRDEDGKLVAKSKIRATCATEDGIAAREQITDDKGEFTFENLAPDGFYSFEVVDARFAPSRGFGTSLPGPARPCDMPIQVTAFRPRTLVGKVVDEGGKSVADASVTLIREVLPDGSNPQPNSSYNLLETKSDADGRFKLENLRPGKAGIFLEKPGFAKTYCMAVDVDAGEARLTIHDGLTCKGRVTANGKPLSKVTVSAGSINFSHRDMGSYEVITDADGRFVIEHIADLSRYDGQFAILNLSVDQPDWHSPWYAIYKEKGRSALPEVDVKVSPGGRPSDVRETITLGEPDLSNSPMYAGMQTGNASLRVTIQQNGDGPQDSASVSISRSDVPRTTTHTREKTIRRGESAEFTDLPAGRYRVVWNGFSAPTIPPAEIDVREGKPADITLRPGPCKLVASFRGPDGPVKVSARAFSKYPAIGFYYGWAKKDQTDLMEFEGLNEGEFEIEAWVENAVPIHGRVTVRGPETRVDWDLPRGTITGRIAGIELNKNGPLGNNIRFSTRDRGNENGTWLKVNDDGSFQLNYVPPGECTFFAWNMLDNRMVTRTVTIDEQHPNAQIELNLSSPTGAIVGRISDLPKEPPHPSSFGNPLTAIWFDERGIDIGRTYTGQACGVGGEFEILDLPPGKYVVCAAAAPAASAPQWFGECEVRAGLARKLDATHEKGREVHLAISAKAKWIEMRDLEIRMPRSSRFISCGALGLWSLEEGRILAIDTLLAPGKYSLRVAKLKEVPVDREFTVEPGETAQSINVDFP